MKTIAILLVSGLACFAGNKASRPVKLPKHGVPLVGVSLNAADWNFWFGQPEVGASIQPLSDSGGWFFDFPQAPEDLTACLDPFGLCPQVDYVATRETAPITNAFLTITVGVVVPSGYPVFNFRTESGNTCDVPASVRPVLIRYNDDFATDGNRWWSNPIHFDLAEGIVTLTIPMTPDNWSGIFGKMADTDAITLYDFAQTKATPGNVGFSFGGGCFFGHGVNVYNGTAQFVCLNYQFHD